MQFLDARHCHYIYFTCHGAFTFKSEHRSSRCERTYHTRDDVRLGRCIVRSFLVVLIIVVHVYEQANSVVVERVVTGRVGRWMH